MGKGEENQDPGTFLRSSQASGGEPVTGVTTNAGSAASQEGTGQGRGSSERTMDSALGRDGWRKLGESTKVRAEHARPPPWENARREMQWPLRFSRPGLLLPPLPFPETHEFMLLRSPLSFSQWRCEQRLDWRPQEAV